jgi:hypothetical protein
MCQVRLAHLNTIAQVTCLEQIDRAQKSIHKGRGRVLIDFLRCTDLLYIALVHQHNPVGHFQRFFLVVRHKN